MRALSPEAVIEASQTPIATEEVPAAANVLRVSGLGKTVSGPGGRLRILEAVDFAAQAGEALAIIGPSGSGKSTLLGLLAGLDAPTEGDVELLGKSLAALDEDGRAALRAGRVGFVFQSFQLLPGLTALENVLLPLELAELDQPRQRALDMLDSVGLAERVDHYPGQLSGGEQQRVALARAFASQPQILFADEPTGNLDEATGHRVIELMFKLRAEQGCTLVLVTHDNELAARCDRRLLMHAGQLGEQA
jgi:putative ABC transport system ATP-binding protein